MNRVTYMAEFRHTSGFEATITARGKAHAIQRWKCQLRHENLDSNRYAWDIVSELTYQEHEQSLC